MQCVVCGGLNKDDDHARRCRVRGGVRALVKSTMYKEIRRGLEVGLTDCLKDSAGLC